MTPLTDFDDGELLRPEPAVLEPEAGSGMALLVLMLAGFALFAVSAKDIQNIATPNAACPVAAVAYCDRW